MKQYIESVTDELTGLPIGGAEVFVYDDDNNLAVLYAADTTTEIDNPLTTNEDGEFSFYSPTTELTALVYFANRLRRRLRLLVGGGYSAASAASASVAEAFAGPTYDSTVEGLAATEIGESFAVYAAGVTTVYLHEAGPVATEIRKTLAPATLAASGGAALVGNQLPAGSNLAIQPVSDFIDNNILQPSQFAGTAEQQLTRAITEANASRNGGQGQTVQLPRGEIVTLAPFNLANRVTLMGVNKRGTRIKAGAGHSGSFMMTVDNGSSSMFDNAVERLTLDCNDVAGLGGVDSEAWQEGGGLRDVLVQKFRTYGVRFREMEGGAALCRVTDSELFGSASGCTAGILLDDSSLNNAFQLVVEHSTLSGGGAAASSMPRAIDVQAGSLHIYSCHVENCETGIYLDGSGNHTIIGFNGASTAGGVTNLVEIAATFTGTLTMIGCQRNGSTNLIKDNRSGGFGTISYDVSFFQILAEPPLGRGAIVASASIDGVNAGGGGVPVVSKGFGVSGVTKNGTGDLTITLTRSAQAASDFAVFASTNHQAGNVRCDLNGVNSVRLRCFDADGTTPRDVNELKILVVRVA